MFASSDYRQDRKSGDCGCSGPPVSKNSGRQNPVWRALAVRAGQPSKDADEPVKDEEPRKLTPEEQREEDYRREHYCVNQPDPDKPQRKPLTQRERGRATFGIQSARSITSKAYSNLAQRDPYHLRKAEKTFKQPVSFETLDSHFLRIKTKLEGLVLNQNVVAATCDEKDCNTGRPTGVPSFTSNDLKYIVLCPFFFTQKGGSTATTFIHEAGHMAHIDVNWSPGNETYCRPDDAIDCGNVCPITGENLLENVDAWMRLIYCVAGGGY